ncbi:Hypothetical_protein [Hexamita inflata]|uniref:Hypothetical_protein n=1 Tax=Hexamita inflata TaxID=28002 RepID=A0AA86PB45_9EUKA|nr:Hypothetical protein HINF_LOCUS22918 [Hexamita inflata]
MHPRVMYPKCDDEQDIRRQLNHSHKSGPPHRGHPLRGAHTPHALAAPIHTTGSTRTYLDLLFTLFVVSDEYWAVCLKLSVQDYLQKQVFGIRLLEQGCWNNKNIVCWLYDINIFVGTPIQLASYIPFITGGREGISIE